MERDAQIDRVREMYRSLLQAWGPQHWWPAESPFEVIVGAFLTQNTAWTNVERAMHNLRCLRLLSIGAIRNLQLEDLEIAIRPAGYFRQKAQRLKRFIGFLHDHYGGSLTRMFSRPTDELRAELLALNGIGPETADSILLYAGSHPVFVVDAYTRRILDRHKILPATAKYDEIRALFESALGPQFPGTLTAAHIGQDGTAHQPSRMSTATRSDAAQRFNDMHGLIVAVGKNHCFKSKANCQNCPLAAYLP